LYGVAKGKSFARRTYLLMRRYRVNKRVQTEHPFPFTEKDAFLITYGDQFRREGEAPLETLTAFLGERCGGWISGVHILPFFPYSSDDGFSVIDYYTVSKAVGRMSDIERIANSYALMADLVCNHCSAQGEWFQGFLAGRRRYRDFFIVEDKKADWSRVMRPRTTPLFTSFVTRDGEVSVWTTFSPDQVDLNYKNPRVLLEMTRVLLFYAAKGVRVFRLDAVAYLWKETSTPCVHLPQVHAVIRFFRAVLEATFPGTLILTETNVPHRENLSYLGKGNDEAHMVYQFALPPLVLDAFLRENCNKLRQWLSELTPLTPHCAYFNFLASHDGIGLLPAKGILTEDERAHLVRVVKERGGMVSERTSDAGTEPYELNITYLDAIAERSLSPSQRAKKFLASQSLLFSLPGIPGVYVHSLVGSENWSEGVSASGVYRAINREKLLYTKLCTELDTPGSLRNLVFGGFMRMLKVRAGLKAFHPAAGFRVIACEGPDSVLSLLRFDDENEVLVVLNASSVAAEASFDPTDLGGEPPFTDALSEKEFVSVEEDTSRFVFYLEPFAVHWLIVKP